MKSGSPVSPVTAGMKLEIDETLLEEVHKVLEIEGM